MAIQFDEERTYARRVGGKKSSGLTKMVMSMGLAKSESGAQGVLLVVAVIALGIAGYLVMSGAASGTLPAPVPNAAWPK